MSYLTRPSNVRVYQFRQPPGCEPVDFTARFIRHNARRRRPGRLTKTETPRDKRAESGERAD
jgi:hypothetical protein